MQEGEIQHRKDRYTKAAQNLEMVCFNLVDVTNSSVAQRLRSSESSAGHSPIRGSVAQSLASLLVCECVYMSYLALCREANLPFVCEWVKTDCCKSRVVERLERAI